MKILTLGVLCLGMFACSDSGCDVPDFGVVDAYEIQRDAPWPDAICNSCTCNPLTQGGCNAGEKCTWIYDQADPPVGHVGCAPDSGAAAIAIGGACAEPPAGPSGYDQCVTGAACIAGACKQVCDRQGGYPFCEANLTCMAYPDFFEVGGTTVAGVCEPACDPLTQDLLAGTVMEACGSPSATQPTQGCYGRDVFTCMPAPMSVYALTDRTSPRTNAVGVPYPNGCAPGFIPLITESLGSTVIKCTGLCAALEVDNTTIDGRTPVEREDGDLTAVGKLVTTAKAAGDAVCSVGTKGSRDSSMCMFLWPFLANELTGELPAQFMTGPNLDTLGVCIAVEYFAMPNCRDLPRRTPGDTIPDNDAADWGCQKYSNTVVLGTKPSVNPILSTLRVPQDVAVELVRHDLN